MLKQIHKPFCEDRLAQLVSDMTLPKIFHIKNSFCFFLFTKDLFHFLIRNSTKRQLKNEQVYRLSAPSRDVSLRFWKRNYHLQ